MNTIKKNDLMNCSLNFSISSEIEKKSEFDIFKMVSDGKISLINEYIIFMIKKYNVDELIPLITKCDSEGKTLLFYAW